MTHRAILASYEGIQSSGTAGTFQIIAAVHYIDDANTHPFTGNIYTNFSYTMTAAQIQAAIIADIIDLGAASGYTLAANNNQIIIPSMAKV
jgi:hypothetical protein